MKKTAYDTKARVLDLFGFVGMSILPVALFFAFSWLNAYLALALMLGISIPTLRALINGAPYVPTPMVLTRKMVALAKINPGDLVLDLGCGDGRFVYLAANEYQGKAIGYELSPFVFLLALIRKFLWGSKAQIKFQNFKKVRLHQADHIFCYLLPDTLKSFAPKLIKEIKPGCKIYSYAFEIPGLKLISQKQFRQSGCAPIWIYQKV